MPPVPKKANPVNANSIDIDLHLLAEDDMKKFKDIFDDFKLTINTFSTDVAKLSRGLAGLGAGGRGVPGSTTGNNFGRYEFASPQLTTAIGAPEASRERQAQDASARAKGASNAHAAHALGFAGLPFLGGVMHGMDTFKKDIRDENDNIDPMKLFGALAVGEQGMKALRKVPRIGARFRNVLAQPQQVAFGQNLGYSRSGFLGTPIGSAAQRAGLGSEWTAMKASWFGLNPNYSSADAGAAQSAIAGMGIGDQARKSRLTYDFRAMQQNTGIGADQISQMMLPGIRYGGTSIGNMVAEINNIPRAAQMAGQTVESFTQSLISSSQQLASTSGISPTAASQQLLYSSATTREDPSLMASNMSNQTLRGMSLAATGGNFYAVMGGPHAGSINAQSQQKMILMLTGQSSWAQLQAIAKQGGAPWAAIRNRLFAMYSTGQWPLGSMTPTDVVNLINRPGNFVNITRAQETTGMLQSTVEKNKNLANAVGGNRTLDNNISTIEKQLSLNPNQIKSLQGLDYKDRLNKLQDFAKKASSHTQAESNRVTVDLAPQARGLLRLLKDTPADRVNAQNSGQPASVSQTIFTGTTSNGVQLGTPGSGG